MAINADLSFLEQDQILLDERDDTLRCASLLNNRPLKPQIVELIQGHNVSMLGKNGMMAALAEKWLFDKSV
jgi:hypothetical protein